MEQNYKCLDPTANNPYELINKYRGITKLLLMSHLFDINLYVSDVVFEHRGHVDLRELVLAEDDKKTGLATSSISNYHQLLPDGCHPWR